MTKAKIGLEIHQRLDTGKLFCKCQSKIKEEKGINFVYRELNLTQSEIGEIDKAALMQLSKGAGFYYFGLDDICLVELDEEPPLKVNKNALLMAINTALQMEMDIVDAIIFMRKLIIDGSNTSGFQRTALIGLNGKILVKGKYVNISTLNLEEESAGIIDDNIFDLKRLGIPLLEISTYPEIENGKDARDVAETIGLMLRTLPYTARGIGTIRQDLNISIEGGARVEIKGAQELNMLEKWINNEIKRQEDLIIILQERKKRGIKEAIDKVVDATETFLSYEHDLATFINEALKRNEKVFIARAKKHKGLLSMKCGERRYGSELADHARIYGLKGLIHSDENLEKYGINKELVIEINKILELSEDDAFIILVGKEDIVKKAMEAVKERASMDFVPSETRKALPDGNTCFLRPLPGRARLYPETDIPYIIVDEELKKEALSIAETFYKKVERLEKMLNKELAYKILKGKHLFFFEELSNFIDPVIVAVTLEDTITKIKRERNIEIDEDNIKKALMMYKEGRITKKAIEEAMIMLQNGENEEEIIKKIGKMSKEEIMKIYEEIKDKKEVLKRYPLRIDAKDLEEILT
jgi:glutamyl-tRNA(Gln) amidotransferase subunit E